MSELQRYAPVEMDDRIDMVADSAGHWVKGPEAESALAEKHERALFEYARYRTAQDAFDSVHDEAIKLKARIAELEREVDVLKYGAVCVQAEPKEDRDE